MNLEAPSGFFIDNIYNALDLIILQVYSEVECKSYFHKVFLSIIIKRCHFSHAPKHAPMSI